jgi:hypothetical protein
MPDQHPAHPSRPSPIIRFAAICGFISAGLIVLGVMLGGSPWNLSWAAVALACSWQAMIWEQKRAKELSSDETGDRA